MTAGSVLVTGATGFVGAHLTRRLVADGWDVHLVVGPGSDLARLGPAADRVRAHVHDGTTEGLIALVGAAGPDPVIHLASLFLAQHAPADVAGLVASNVLFGTQLVEAMAQHGVTRLLNTGTSWQQYENRDGAPVNLNAATKEAFEAVLAYYVEAQGLRVLTLKLFDTYGPDDPRPKLLTLLRRTAASQQPLAMSPGEQLPWSTSTTSSPRIAWRPSACSPTRSRSTSGTPSVPARRGRCARWWPRSRRHRAPGCRFNGAVGRTGRAR